MSITLPHTARNLFKNGRPMLKLPSSTSLYPFQNNFHTSSSSSSSSSRLHQPFFAFDLDGVVKQGEEILPSGKRALKRLKHDKIPFCIITNSGGSGEVQRAHKLSEQLETEISPDQLVLSHTVMKSLSKLYSNEPILMIGGPEVPVGLSKSVMESYGFNNIYTCFDLQNSHPSSYPFGEIPKEQIESTRKDLDFSKIKFRAILVFHDSRNWCRDLQYMLDLLRSKDGVWGSLGNGRQSGNAEDPEWKGQIPVYFSHNDVLWGNDFPVSRLGQGSFKLALESIFKSVTSQELISQSFGKPHLMTYEYADELLREQSLKLGFYPSPSPAQNDEIRKMEKERIWMIGDNPESDILGAINFNWSSALVKTGVWKQELGEPKYKPTIITEDVEEAVEEAFRLQSERAKNL